jgi:ABC-2 type transport system permease protein
MLRNALAVAWKDLQVFVRDKGQLMVLFFLPLAMASLMGSIYSPRGGANGGTPKLPIALVNHDGGPYGAQVAKTLQGIEALKVEDLGTSEEADRLVANSKALAAVVIPADFSRKVDAYEPGRIEIIVDPAQQQYASIITGIMKEVVTPVVLQGELQYGIRTVLSESQAYREADPQTRRAVEAQNLGVLMTQLLEMRENPLIVAQDESLARAKALRPSNLFGIFVPDFTVMFAFFLTGTVAVSLFTEKEQGSLRRLLAAPMPRGAILAGKVLAHMVVVILQVLVLFGVATIIFRMPLGHSPLGLALVTLALALAATSLGMLIGALSRSRRQADGLGMVLGFVLGGLGGCIQVGLTPLFRTKGPLGTLSQFTPHAHALEAFFRLMLEGGGVVDILPQVGILVGMGLLFLLVAIWRFRFE